MKKNLLKCSNRRRINNIIECSAFCTVKFTCSISAIERGWKKQTSTETQNKGFFGDSMGIYCTVWIPAHQTKVDLWKRLEKHECYKQIFFLSPGDFLQQQLGLFVFDTEKRVAFLWFALFVCFSNFFLNIFSQYAAASTLIDTFLRFHWTFFFKFLFTSIDSIVFVISCKQNLKSI